MGGTYTTAMLCDGTQAEETLTASILKIPRHCLVYTDSGNTYISVKRKWRQIQVT